MKDRRANHADTRPLATVQTLVISQHEVVRGQLVAYLTRSLDLSVRGEAFRSDAILRAQPDVVVLDLSQIGHAGLVAAIDEARCVDAGIMALASIYDLTDDGTFGGDASLCGASAPGMPITWGGPIATFRWDSAEDVDFRWLSVREIQ